MELTGKCKDDFEKWYLKDQHNEEGYHDYLLRSFYSKGLAMQYGVYEDFFESVGYDIEIGINSVLIFSNHFIDLLGLNVLEGVVYDIGVSNRQEARTKAIEKGNEIYNN
jgi:hypothetical protein